MGLLKAASALVGVILTLGGFLVLVVGLYLVAQNVFIQPSGPHMAGSPVESPPSMVAAIACVVGGIVAVYLGTQLGRFVRGDFD